ncbi:NAD-dependent epimerase/dehydratase family protein [Aquicoccus sp. SCR17]|nr:NAD-dependent epimerase/dehydratase family protein [Carideicomes alvinocaridis]
MPGATGRLGGILLRHWRDAPPAGLEIVPVARRAMPGAVVWTPGTDPAPLGRADAVLALWGVTAGNDAALGANRDLALAAMELARATGADRVLHCSSAAVYPPGPGPLDEEVPPAPARPYGAAKLAMERAVADWAAANPGGPRACCLRIANVAGADSLFTSLEGEGPVTLDRFADGRGPRRSYVAGADLARACAALLTLPPEELPEVVNVCGPRPVGMDALVRAAGRDLRWRDAPEGAIPEVALSDARLAALGAAARESDRAEALVADWRRLR